MTHDNSLEEQLETLSPEMAEQIRNALLKTINSARAVKSDPEKIAEKLELPKPRKKNWKQKILALIGVRHA